MGRCIGVVHHQPGFVDAGREGLQAEIGTHTVVGQRFHQCEGHAGDNGRARQRQGHFADAPGGPGAEQPRRLHQGRATFDEGGARQQVNVGVEAEHEQDRGAPKRANVGPHGAAGTAGSAQSALQRTAVLQSVGGGVGQNVGGHGQGQQQRPLEAAAQWEVEQSNQHRRTAPYERHAQCHCQSEEQRIERVLR